MARRALLVGLLVLSTTLVVGPSPAVASLRQKTDAKVKVVLSEWIVKPKPKTVDAGRVTFVAKNRGGEEHELVITPGDDAAALPTDSAGAVDESTIEDEIVGEIEDVPAQKSKQKTFKLSPGKYVLFCNIVDEMGDVHFAEGMHSVITVR